MENPELVMDATLTTKFTHSGYDSAAVKIVEEYFIKKLKENQEISVETGFDYNATEQVADTAPYPIVCIISGAGGNGKDTFINAVSKVCVAANLSSIDPIKEIADTLIQENAAYQYEHYMTIDGGKHQNQKTDQYRQFLYDLKKAWSTFCDGPNVYLMGKLQDILSDQNSGNGITNIVFMHVREASEIANLKQMIEDYFGIAVITVKLVGLVNPADYQNDCDKNVDDYTFDLTITNHPGNTMMLELQAMMFGSIIRDLSYTNGIFPSNYIETAPYVDDATSTIYTETNNIGTTTAYNQGVEPFHDNDSTSSALSSQ